MESNRWLLVAFLAGGLLIGVAGYSVGLSQGAARAALAAGTDIDTLGAYWGHGHGWWGFPFGPIIAIFFWLWIIRALFWGIGGPWGWRRRWRHYPYDDDPRWFDERHRRAHQRGDRAAGKSEV